MHQEQILNSLIKADPTLYSALNLSEGPLPEPGQIGSLSSPAAKWAGGICKTRSSLQLTFHLLTLPLLGSQGGAGITAPCSLVEPCSCGFTLGSDRQPVF